MWKPYHAQCYTKPLPALYHLIQRVTVRTVFISAPTEQTGGLQHGRKRGRLRAEPMELTPEPGQLLSTLIRDPWGVAVQRWPRLLWDSSSLSSWHSHRHPESV